MREDASKVFANAVFDKDGTAAALKGKVAVLDSHPSIDPHVPMAHAGYAFPFELFGSLLTWWHTPHGQAMMLTGPTGSGKTSAILEMAARLHWPVFSCTLHERTEFASLRGQWLLQSVKGSAQPEMRFQEGPLIKAMRLGGVLLLNEFDIAPAGEMSALNDIIEGRPLMVPEMGGEVIHPHPNFRVAVTANTKGQGDESGLYQGTQQQNVAALDRYRCLEVGYMPKEIEIQIVKAVWMSREGMPENGAEFFATKQTQVAEKIRSQFIGVAGCDGSLSVPMSTRCLVHWTEVACDYRGAPNALQRALDEVLLNRASKEDALAIRKIAESVFGPVWTNPAAAAKKAKKKE